jgi:hemerythrin-like domain-containing protein
LEREHAGADLQHANIDAIGRRWLSNGVLSDIDRATLRSLVESLSTLYVRHIEVEEREIFSVAKQVLSQQEKQRLGREMAQRRGLDSDTFDRRS